MRFDWSLPFLRFCGVSNSSVKRSVNGKSVVMDPVLNKKVEVSSVSPKIEPIPDNPNLGKEKVDSSSLNERKAEGEEVKQEGGKKSLTNLWGRASAKSKPPEITDISKASGIYIYIYMNLQYSLIIRE